MSRVVKPININLSVMDTLLVIEGLDAIMRDNKRHEIDKAGAKRLKARILEAVHDNAIEIERGD